MKILLFSCLTACLAGSTFADAPSFDPKAYIDQKEAAAAKKEEPKAAATTLVEGEVSINGVRYRKFQSAYGALLVPQLGHFTRTDVERGLCGNPGEALVEKCAPDDTQCIEKIVHPEEKETADVLRAERAISADAKIYAKLITDAIYSRCSGPTGDSQRQRMQIRPEAGIELKDSHKPGDPGYKVFVKPGKTGVGMDF